MCVYVCEKSKNRTNVEKSVCRLPRLQLFEMKTGSEVTPTQCLTLPQSPLDTTFDPQGRLWVLLDDQHTPVLLYTHTSQCWEVHSHTLTHTHTPVLLYTHTS